MASRSRFFPAPSAAAAAASTPANAAWLKKLGRRHRQRRSRTPATPALASAEEAAEEAADRPASCPARTPPASTPAARCSARSPAQAAPAPAAASAAKEAPLAASGFVQAEDAQGACGICLDAVSERGVIPCCDHRFCFACIKQWSSISNTCPLCKRAFRTIEAVETIDQVGPRSTDGAAAGGGPPRRRVVVQDRRQRADGDGPDAGTGFGSAADEAPGVGLYDMLRLADPAGFFAGVGRELAAHRARAEEYALDGFVVPDDEAISEITDDDEALRAVDEAEAAIGRRRRRRRRRRRTRRSDQGRARRTARRDAPSSDAPSSDAPSSDAPSSDEGSGAGSKSGVRDRRRAKRRDARADGAPSTGDRVQCRWHDGLDYAARVERHVPAGLRVRFEDGSTAVVRSETLRRRSRRAPADGAAAGSALEPAAKAAPTPRPRLRRLRRAGERADDAVAAGELRSSTSEESENEDDFRARMLGRRGLKGSPPPRAPRGTAGAPGPAEAPWRGVAPKHAGSVDWTEARASDDGRRDRSPPPRSAGALGVPAAGLGAAMLDRFRFAGKGSQTGPSERSAAAAASGDAARGPPAAGGDEEGDVRVRRKAALAARRRAVRATWSALEAYDVNRVIPESPLPPPRQRRRRDGEGRSW